MVPERKVYQKVESRKRGVVRFDTGVVNFLSSTETTMNLDEKGVSTFLPGS